MQVLVDHVPDLPVDLSLPPRLPKSLPLVLEHPLQPSNFSSHELLDMRNLLFDQDLRIILIQRLIESLELHRLEATVPL